MWENVANHTHVYEYQQQIEKVSSLGERLATFCQGRKVFAMREITEDNLTLKNHNGVSIYQPYGMYCDC